MVSKGCGTCRDRKILCDRALPGCTQCKRSKKQCAGYGLRLSWPGANNKKRAIVGRPAGHNGRSQRLSNDRWVHVTHWDIEMYHHLDHLANSTSEAPHTLELFMSFSPYKVEDGDGELFDYFRHNASRSLTIFGNDPKDMGGLLMRMAFSSRTHSTRAVKQSLLALTSLHRYGLNEHAFKSKIATLRALSDASQSSIGSAEAMQHIAAGMLLCSFEIHQSSCTSAQWTWYISGVKGIIRRGLANATHIDGDVGALLDWVYYHDVMARFSLSHMGKKPEEDEAGPPLCGLYAEISHNTPPNFAILQLLSTICDVSMLDSPDSDPTGDHSNFLTVLEWRIKSVPLLKSSDASAMIIQELYQISTFIYFHRTVGKDLHRTDPAQETIKRGFEILSQMSSCERQFPMFVLGCEARTDEQRGVILNIMEGTERTAASRSLNYLRRILNALWAQDDLAEQELDHREKLGAIFSHCAILPTFV